MLTPQFLPSLRLPFRRSLPIPFITMNRSLSLLLFLAATAWRVSAAIGPTADLEIVNANISPDGFNRSFVLNPFSGLKLSLIIAALCSPEVPFQDH